MDTAPRTATAPSRSRTGSLLALALAASTALSVLSPVGASSSAPLVDVVVTSTSSGVGAVADAVRAAGGVVRDALPLTGGVSASLPADAVLAPSFRVVENAPLSLASESVAPATRTPTAIREALGLGEAKGEGAGVTIAVVDTGVADSPEFSGRLTHYAVPGTTRGKSGLADEFGHGTFVAGVAAAAGAETAAYAGVAPGAHVLDIRVAGADGSTDLITVLKGLQKAAELGADVVNLSLSSGSQLPYQVDPLTIALQRLWQSGVVVVVPSGNDGENGTGSVTSPGIDPTLLTVGASDEKLTAGRSDDVVAPFSGRGPTPQGDVKPDLVAPGTSLVSVRAPGSYVDQSFGATAAIGTSYFRGSGTSFATSAVAGAVATLLAEKPDLTPDQVKAMVMGTTYTTGGFTEANAAGTGGLDLAALLAAEAPAVPAAEDDAPPAGDEVAWRAFLQALMDDDRAAAAKAWAAISPAGHRWAGHRWGGHRWGGHRWGANSWSGHRWAGHRWAGGGVSAEEWEMRFWAGHRWAGHRWGSDDWVGHRWAGHRWANDEFAGHRWAGHRWAQEEWAGHRWAGHRWAGHRWAASGWVASRWA